jgi:hypothetical protein
MAGISKMLMFHYKATEFPLSRTKIFPNPLAGETIKMERSSENGLNPLKLLPALLIGQNRQ